MHVAANGQGIFFHSIMECPFDRLVCTCAPQGPCSSATFERVYYLHLPIMCTQVLSVPRSKHICPIPVLCPHPYPLTQSASACVSPLKTCNGCTQEHLSTPLSSAYIPCVRNCTSDKATQYDKKALLQQKLVSHVSHRMLVSLICTATPAVQTMMLSHVHACGIAQVPGRCTPTWELEHMRLTFGAWTHHPGTFASGGSI